LRGTNPIFHRRDAETLRKTKDGKEIGGTGAVHCWIGGFEGAKTAEGAENTKTVRARGTDLIGDRCGGRG
jgi:hypothetical protein